MASPPRSASLDRPWVASYPPGVPPTYRLPTVRLPRLLDDAARDFPQHTAVVAGRVELTYEQLHDQVDIHTRALEHQGIGEGDRILVMLETGISLLIVLIALWRRGATAVPVPADAVADQVAMAATDAGVLAVMGTAEAVSALEEHDAIPRVSIIVAGDEWRVPGTGRRLLRTPRRPRIRVPRPRAGHRAGRSPERAPDDASVVYTLRDLLDDAARASVESAAAACGDAVDPTDLLGTEASSSAPPVGQAETATVDGPALVAVGLGPGGVTAVEHSHRTLLATAFQSRLWVPDVQAARERILVAEPLHDIVGLAIGVLAALLSGATTILLDDPSVSGLAKAIERHRPTLLVARSGRVVHLLDEGEAAKRDLTSLRVCLAVGEGLPDPVARDLERRSGGARFRTLYGCGDAAPITHGQPVYGRVIPTAMGLPVTDTLAVVVNPDDMSTLRAVDEAGLLLVRGPQIPEVGTACADGRSVDGWLVTDTVARVNGDGWFTIVGQRDQLLVRAGDPVPAQRLADALCRRPDVRDAEVILVDEQVVAAVVSAKRRPPHPDALLEVLAGSFDSRSLPDRILLVTDLPRTEDDVIDREALQIQVAGLLCAGELSDSEAGADDERTR